MEKSVMKIIMLFWVVCFFVLNKSHYCIDIEIEKLETYYPKECNITITNLNKKDVEKIEVFVKEEDDKDGVGIDGRLFNVREPNGEVCKSIKCKKNHIINQKDIKQIENGIKFVLLPSESCVLKIYLKNGKEIYSYEFDPGMNVMYIRGVIVKDEEKKKYKEFEKSTVYFIGDFEKINASNPWIKMEKMKTDMYTNVESNTGVELDKNGIVIAIIVLMGVVIVLLYNIVKQKRTNKRR